MEIYNTITLFYQVLYDSSSIFRLELLYTINMNFAERLKELRKERNMSQMDLALATKLSQSAIAKWELNKTEPTASALIALSAFFGETTDFLLGLTDD